MRRTVCAVFLAVLLLVPQSAAARDLVVGEGAVAPPSEGMFRNNVVNARVALRHLDGAVVAPGQELSFNRAVGERTSERGFVHGLSLVNGSYARDLGGGVCQASTALHRAVADAGLDVVERHLHTRVVPYAPGRDDAAVWWGKKDYRFRNTLPFPVRVRTDSEGLLRVSLVVEGLPEGRAVFHPWKPAAVVGEDVVRITPPYIEEGRMCAPAAVVARVLGVRVEDLAARIGCRCRGGVLYVPLRAAVTAFGRGVEWDAVRRCAVVP